VTTVAGYVYLTARRKKERHIRKEIDKKERNKEGDIWRLVAITLFFLHTKVEIHNTNAS